jgi:hypothetical protein
VRCRTGRSSPRGGGRQHRRRETDRTLRWDISQRTTPEALQQLPAQEGSR